MAGLRKWESAIAWGAFGKALLGFTLYVVAFVADPAGLSVRTHLMAAHVATYGSVGAFLMLRGGRDQQAVLWGVILLMTAAVFADPTFGGVSARFGWASLVLGAGYMLQFNAFSAYFLWRFVVEFPRVSWFGTRGFVLTTMMRTSLLIGAVLFLSNLVGVALAEPTNPESYERSPVWTLLRDNPSGAYWALFYTLALPCVVALLMKLPAARPSERRRVWLLITSYIIGTFPTTLWVFAANMWPGFGEAVPLSLAGWVIYPALLSPPFTTAYAVVVHNALDVRLVARSAFQYAMARYTLAFVAVAPLIPFVMAVYQNRTLSLAELATDPRSVTLFLVSVGGIVGFAFRTRILELVDRLLFREVYEARRTLRGLVVDSRNANSRTDLGLLLSDGLQEAFRPDSVHVLFESGGVHESPLGSHRGIPARAALLELLEKEGELLIDLSKLGTAVRELPEEDRFWLADGGVRLLMAMRDATGRTRGLLALGHRRSELPYTRQDRRRLREVLDSAVVTLDYLDRSADAAPAATQTAQADVERAARECLECSRVGDGSDRCEQCGGELRTAAVPLTLANKFRLAERLGAGAMGVVYRAVDTSLGRSVAIKTLPRTTPGHASRLRHEARAMASVSHPNLALIFGGESWQGTPMLVFEYLGGGTLEDRIAEGPLSSEAVLDIGVALAHGVEAIHRAGILHRDIKPSNIGFTEEGVPKLLDFGLARILGEAGSRSAPQVKDIHGAQFNQPEVGARADLTVTQSDRLVGTPLYLSPEAVQGQPPGPDNDLWALAMSLYEAAAGSNPMMRDTLALTFVAIMEEGVPDLREIQPGADGRLSDFLRRTLSPDPTRRIRTAREFAREISLLERVAAA